MWIDESYHEGSIGGVYVLAGVADTKSDLRLLTRLAGNRSYLHWADRAQRQQTVEAINTIRPNVSLWVAHGVRRKRQEPARSRCFDALLRGVPDSGSLRIEGRRDQQDDRDRSTIRNTDRVLGGATDFEFVTKTASPLLWIADAGAGMASSYFSSAKGSDHWWRQLRPNILTIAHLA
jgi:hypothetical protein